MDEGAVGAGVLNNAASQLADNGIDGFAACAGVEAPEASRLHHIRGGIGEGQV